LKCRSPSTTDLTAALREFVSFKDRHPNFAQRIQNLHEVEGSLLASDVE
jgi:hypothetical protein